MPPDAPSVNASQKRWVLVCAILGSTLSFVDGSIVNVALPRIEADLHTTLASMQWVINAYTLSLSSLLLIGGAAGDRLGRRRIFVIGIVLFTVASIACGLAPGAATLIAARAVQGVGAAFLVPSSLALISAAYDERERGAAIGFWSGASAIAAGAAPVIGGWVVDHASWRAIFLINPVLAVPTLWLALRHLTETRDTSARGALDWQGALSTFVGLGAIVYGLIAAAERGWNDPVVGGSILAGVLLMLCFIWIERRSVAPVVPLALFASKRFSGVNLLTLFLYGALGGTFFFVPFLIIQVHGYSAAAAGSIFVPFALILGALSKWSGGLMDRVGARWPLIIGPTIAGSAMWLLAVHSGDDRFGAFVLPIVVLAFGMAITIAPLTTSVLNAVKQHQTGIASGINNAVASVASLLVIALSGTVAVRVLDAALDVNLQRAGANFEVRREIDTVRGGFVMPQTAPKLDAADRDSVQNIARRSFIVTIHVILLAMAALAFAGACVAVVMIE